MENEKKIVLFSGRMDPPHLGHFKSICELGKKFDFVKIIILDYPERKYPASIAKQILDECISCTNVQYEIIVNTIHFALITKEELAKFKLFTHYAAGNMEVLKHLSKFERELFFQLVWVDRRYFYEASKYITGDNK